MSTLIKYTTSPYTLNPTTIRPPSPDPSFFNTPSYSQGIPNSGVVVYMNSTVESVQDSIRKFESILLKEKKDDPGLNSPNSIEERINARTLTLPQINWLLIHSTPSVNLWGSRSINVAGSDTSLSLSKIAELVRDIAKQADTTDLNARDAIAGVQCIRKLRNLYETTDNMISQSNYFTRISELFFAVFEEGRKLFASINYHVFKIGYPHYTVRDEIEYDPNFKGYGPFQPEDVFLEKIPRQE